MTARSAGAPGAVSARTYGMLVLANLFWAGNYVFAPLVLRQFSPLQMVFARWAIAIVPLLVLAQLIDKPDWRAAAREWPRHLIQALLGVVGYPLMMYQGLLYTTPLDAALLGAINPALIVVLAAILIRERISLRVIVGMLVSIAGALLVITRGDLTALAKGGLNIGDLWILGSLVVWTLYSIYSRRVTTPPVTATAMQAILATIILAPITALGGFGPAEPEAVSVWSLLYIALFASVIAFVLWNVGVARAGAARSGIFLNLIMVFTAILGLFLGNPILWIQVIGGVVVFVGVYLSTTSRPLVSRRASAGPE